LKYIFIDPGQEKFGFAVYDEKKNLLVHGIGLLVEFEEKIANIIKKEICEFKFILGDGTAHKKFLKKLKFYYPSADVDLLDEKNSTLEARKLYFEMNPPQGIRRFLPSGLLIPDVEYDDYTAMILAERFFAKKDLTK